MLVLPVPARGSTLLDVALLARVRSTTHSQALHAAHYILVLPRRVTRVWLGAACVTSPFNVAQFQPQATFLQQAQSYAHVQDLPLVCPRHFALRLSPDFWEPARTHAPIWARGSGRSLRTDLTKRNIIWYAKESD
jgi:hypothetical protein